MKKLIFLLMLFLIPTTAEAGRWKGLIASVAAYEIEKQKQKPKVILEQQKTSTGKVIYRLRCEGY